MNPVAIQQAGARLARARLAVETMRALLNGEALATEANVTAAWIDFLYAFNGVYQKLQKGSLLNGKSKAWFGRIKHMRDSDELLSYLHQARNAEEHGLEAITKTEFNTPVLAGTDEKDRANWPKGTIYIPLTLSPGQKAYSEGREITGFRATIRSKIKLVDVKNDKFGDTFPTPRTHLGQRLASMSIPDLAELACQHLDGVITEAGAYVAK